MPPGHSALAAQRTPRFRFARCLPQLSLQPLELSGGTAASEPRPLGAARNHCPFGLQMLQPGRAGQRDMAGCGPGRCAVTLTAVSRISSAAPVLARPGRRAKSLRAGQHALEDHGQVTGEDFRGPPHRRTRQVRQRAGDVTSPRPNVRASECAVCRDHLRGPGGHVLERSLPGPARRPRRIPTSAHAAS